MFVKASAYLRIISISVANVWPESSIVGLCTETRRAKSIRLMYFLLYISYKNIFFKTLFQSKFLFEFDFDEIFTNKRENECSFL